MVENEIFVCVSGKSLPSLSVSMKGPSHTHVHVVTYPEKEIHTRTHIRTHACTQTDTFTSQLYISVSSASYLLDSPGPPGCHASSLRDSDNTTLPRVSASGLRPMTGGESLCVHILGPVAEILGPLAGDVVDTL